MIQLKYSISFCFFSQEKLEEISKKNRKKHTLNKSELSLELAAAAAAAALKRPFR
jgi:hypothetical protein